MILFLSGYFMQDVNGLVEQYLPLALAVANRWARAVPLLADDFASEAGLALWRAALRFDPAKGPFPTWARWRVIRACGARLEKERKKNPAAFRRVGPMIDLDGCEVDAVNSLVDGESPADVRAMVADLLDTLPADRASALVRHVVGGETFGEIGTARGISGNAVGQLIRRDLAALYAAGTGDTPPNRISERRRAERPSAVSLPI